MDLMSWRKLLYALELRGLKLQPCLHARLQVMRMGELCRPQEFLPMLLGLTLHEMAWASFCAPLHHWQELQLQLQLPGRLLEKLWRSGHLTFGEQGQS